MTVLCDSLEFFFHGVKEKKDLGQTKLVFSNLEQFKCIYILYFIADILHVGFTCQRSFKINLLMLKLLIVLFRHK